MKIDKKTVLAIVLGVAAVAVVLYQVMGAFPSPTTSVTSAVAAPTPSKIVSTPQTATASVQADQASSQAADDYNAFIATVKESDLAFNSRNFRNPMTPLVSHLSQAEKRRKVSGPASRVAVGPTNALSLGYTIEGIVWNEMDPLALINDQVVGLREQLNDGSLIMEITPDTVRFTKNGNEYFLVFREE